MNPQTQAVIDRMTSSPVVTRFARPTRHLMQIGDQEALAGVYRTYILHDPDAQMVSHALRNTDLTHVDWFEVAKTLYEHQA